MKTFEDCLNAVQPEWAISLRDKVVQDPIFWDENCPVPTKRQAWQIINLKKMMVIAEAVGMDNDVDLFETLILVSSGQTPPRNLIGSRERFIRICQDPDGDGDESKNLFNPFKPEN